MIAITDQELSRDASAILRRVTNGEEFVVTVDGRPVARLVSVGQSGSADAIPGRSGPRTELRDAPVDEPGSPWERRAAPPEPR